MSRTLDPAQPNRSAVKTERPSAGLMLISGASSSFAAAVPPTQDGLYSPSRGGPRCRRADHRQGGVMTRNTVIVTDATFQDDVLSAGQAQRRRRSSNGRDLPGPVRPTDGRVLRR